MPIYPIEDDQELGLRPSGLPAGYAATPDPNKIEIETVGEPPNGDAVPSTVMRRVTGPDRYGSVSAIDATHREVTKAAYAKENPVYGAWKQLSEEKNFGPYDPEHNPFTEVVRDSPELQEFAGSFLGSANLKHSQVIANRIRDELKNRKIIQDSGWHGTLMEVSASVFSPSNLLPGGAIYKVGKIGTNVVKGALSVGAANAVASGIDEAVLQSNQYTRTALESGFNIGGSFILGGILGGAASGVSSKRFIAMSRALDQELNVGPRIDDAIATRAGAGADRLDEVAIGGGGQGGVGAQVVRTPDLELVGAGGMERIMSFATPTLRVANATEPVTREIGAQLVEPTLAYTRNADGFSTAPRGGSVETRYKTQGVAREGQAVQGVREFWAQHRFGDPKAKVPGLRAMLDRGPGKLTEKDFRIEVGQAMRRGDTHDIPEVAAAAKHVRKVLIDPLADAAIKYKLLDPEVVAKGRPKGNGGGAGGTPAPKGPKGGGPTPPPGPDVIRMYHGGTDTTNTPDIPLWFSTDLRYAEGYAKQSGGSGKVWFVDVPRGHQAVDSGIPGQPFFGNKELPADLAKLRQQHVAGVDPVAVAQATDLVKQFETLSGTKFDAKTRKAATDILLSDNDMMRQVRSMLGIVEGDEIPFAALDGAVAARMKAEVADVFSRLSAGETVDMPPAHVEGHYTKLGTAIAALPDGGVNVGVISRLKPLDDGRIQLSIVRGDGSRFTFAQPFFKEDIAHSRAFYERTSGITVFSRLYDTVEVSSNVLRGELRHENVHGLWRSLDVGVRDRLVGHAQNLQVMNVDARDYFDLVESPHAGDVRDGATLFKVYQDHYSTRFTDYKPTTERLADVKAQIADDEAVARLLGDTPSDRVIAAELETSVRANLAEERALMARLTSMQRRLDDMLAEEHVAHMVEMREHGMLTDRDLAPVLDDIRAAMGIDYRAETWDAQARPMSAVDAATGQAMRRDLDQLGYYSHALEVARGLKQAKGTPEQMLAMLKKGGVKDAEIAATRLDELFEKAKGSRPEPGARSPEAEATGASRILAETPEYKRIEDAAVKAFDRDLDKNSHRYFPDRDELDDDGNSVPLDRDDLPSLYRSDAFTVLPAVAEAMMDAARAAGHDLFMSRSANSGSWYGTLKVKGKPDQKVRLSDHWNTTTRFDAPDINVSPEGGHTPIQFIERMAQQAPQSGDRTNGSTSRSGSVNQITKSQIVAHLEENRVGLKEVVRDRGDDPVQREIDEIIDHGRPIRDRETGERGQFEYSGYLYETRDEAIDAATDMAGRASRQNETGDITKWSRHSLDPSNPTYRETVMHLPGGRLTFDQFAEKARAAGHEPTQEMYQAALNDAWHQKSTTDFSSGHFPEPNIVGHLQASINHLTAEDTKRLGIKPKDGDRAVVYDLDQVQSDAGQLLRDKGVRDEAKIAELKAKLDEATAKYPAASTRRELQDGAIRNFVNKNGVAQYARYAEAMTRLGVDNTDPAIRQIAKDMNKKWEAALVEEQRIQEDVRRLTAELATAESSPNFGNPLKSMVGTTDQWVNIVLRRAIRQAVEAEADAIAIPHGDTVLSYNPGDKDGMAGFYGTSKAEGIVPKNLRKLFERLDKEGATPARISKLETPTKGATNQGHIPVPNGDFGFTVFRLTPAVKRAVLEDGQPMFSTVPRQAVQPRDIESLGANAKYHGPVRGWHGTNRVFDTLRTDQGDGWGLFIGTRSQATEIYSGADTPSDLLPLGMQRNSRVYEVIIDPRRVITFKKRDYDLNVGDVADQILKGKVKDNNGQVVRLSVSASEAIIRHISDGQLNGLPVAQRLLIDDLRAQGIDGLRMRDVKNEGPDAPWQYAIWTQDAVKRAVLDDGQPMLSTVPRQAVQPVEGDFTPAANAKQGELARDITEAIDIVNRIAGRGAVEVRFPERIGLDGIRDDELAAVRELGAASTAQGVYRPGRIDAKPLIELSLSAGDIRTTAGHEAYHHVETALATEAELKLLRSPSEMRRATVMAAVEIGRTMDEVATLPDYEIRAIAFQRYRRLREEGALMMPMHMGVRRFYERLIRTLQNVRNALKGLGFTSMEQIFEDARTGEMAKRAVPSTRPDGIDQLLQSLRASGRGVGYPIAMRGTIVTGLPPDRMASIRAFHGSPHDFDAFSMDKIGTGEGAQTYGHGLYFAENEDVAKSYRDILSPIRHNEPAHERVAINEIERRGSRDAAIRQLSYEIESARDAGSDISVLTQAHELLLTDWQPQQLGRLYTVAIKADASDFLDWDAPLSKQSEKVRAAVKTAGDTSNSALIPQAIKDDITAADWMRSYTSDSSRASVTPVLRGSGIPGIKYKDAGSRGADAGGTYNYVVFDDSLIEIVAKDGKPVSAAEKKQILASVSSADQSSMASVSPLDMSPQARKQRAEEMGFDTETVYYKGHYPYKSGGPITNAYGKVIGDDGPYVPIDGLAGFFSNDPKIASKFAGVGLFDHNAVAPVYLKFGNPLVIDAEGKHAAAIQFEQIAKRDGTMDNLKAFKEAFNNGYDAVIIRNTKDEGDITVIPTMQQVRSTNATFDPSESSSPQLMASFFRQGVLGNPDFRAWFGNSKVIHEGGKYNGRPMVVYRGRQEQWSVMPTRQADKLEADLKKEGLTNTALGKAELDHARRLGDVVWFTDDASTAASYRDGAPEGDILEAYLSIQNPLDLRFDKVGAARLDQIYKEIFGVFADPVTSRLDNAQQIVRDNSKVMEYARARGHDGLIHDDTDIRGRYLHTSYVAFSPSQIKSVDNAGTFDPNNPDIMASFFPTATSSGTAVGRRVAATMARIAPSQATVDKWRVRLQDKVLPIRRQQEAIEARTGVDLPLGQNAYVAEANYHGKAGERMADLQRDVIEPLVEHLRTNGIDGDQLGDYLYARHAGERNAYIRTIDPSNTAGSGMTDADAQAILARVHASPKAAAFAEAVRRVDAMNATARDTLYQSGLISQETYDNWSTAYANYVPLRGFEVPDDANPDGPRIGRGFDIRGPEAMRAMGRRSKSDNPLAYSILQSQQAIVRSEKNRVNKTLLRLVEQNPDPDVWQVYRGETKRRIIKDPITGQDKVETYFVPAAFSHNDKDIVGVKIGGKQVWIQLHNPALAQAMKGVGASDFDHAIVRGMMSVTRFYAQLLTSWNPEFVVGNFFRDVQAALLNSKDINDLPDGARKRMMTEALSLKSIRGIYNALRGDGSKEHAQWFEEFRLAGGKISFMEYNDVDRTKRRIEGLLKEGDMRRALRQTARYVEDVNTSVENGVRLSTYIAMRKAGIPKDRAAFVARELTVNFNRKGEWGSIINSAYIFFNASVQGTTRMLAALKAPAVRKAVYTIVVGSVALDALNYIISGDEDDGENAYDKIKPWVKERNIIIMWPGRKDYTMIPMPYGYNIFAVAGQKIGETARTAGGYGGKMTPAKAAAGIGHAIMSSFNPLGESGTVAQMLVPTMLDPILQVSENKTWHGGPIYPNKFDRNKPDSENYFASVHPFFIDAARALNKWSGGNAARSGSVDISPEVLEHYTQFIGGGIAKFALNTIGTSQRLLQGDEFVPEKTPIVRRLYGVQTSSSRKRDFFEEWTKVDSAHHEVIQLNKAGERDGSMAARKEWAPELEAYGAMRGTQRSLSEFGKQRAQIQLNRSMSDAEKKTKIDEIQDKENKLIVRALETYNRAKKQHGVVR